MKKEVKKMALVYPLPIVLLGVELEGKVDYTTVSNLWVMGDNPPVVGLLLDEKQGMAKVIDVKSMLSINYPTTTMIDKVDLCAHVPKHALDKSILFESKYWLETPYIDACPMVLIVEVIEKVNFKKQTLLVCLVRRTLLDEDKRVENHIPSMSILDPIISGQDSMYYKVGHVIGKVSVEGKNLYNRVRKTVAPKPYSFYFKHKLCELKAQGKSYRVLSKKYDVYHETIEDWYALYTMFGREGLTKKMANRLAKTKYAKQEKRVIARKIIHHELTYREACIKYKVSLSRLRNWVKKERRH